MSRISKIIVLMAVMLSACTESRTEQVPRVNDALFLTECLSVRFSVDQCKFLRYGLAAKAIDWTKLETSK